jgi:hypothetical protein
MNANIETETTNADETKSEDGKRSRNPDWLEKLHHLWGEGIVLVSPHDGEARGFADFTQDAWA